MLKVPECSEAFKFAKCCSRADGMKWYECVVGKRSHFHQFHYPLGPWDQNRPASWRCQDSRSESVVRRLRCCSSLPQWYLDLRMRYLLYTSWYMLIHYDLPPGTLTITWDIWTQANSWILDSQVTTNLLFSFCNQGRGIRCLQPRWDFQNMSQPKKTSFPGDILPFLLTFIWTKTQQNTITCLRADVTKDLGRNGDCIWTLRLRIHCKLQGFLHSFLATSKPKWNEVYHHLEHWECISNCIFPPP